MHILCFGPYHGYHWKKKLISDAELVSEHQEVSANVIKKAFLATEEGFLSMVKKNWRNKPHIASAGSCCLVGVISNGTLIVGNAGDSRAVLGRAVKNSKRIIPIQLSEEHNVNFGSVREEVRSLHPHDQQIVMLKHKVWRVKGLIQVNTLCLTSFFTCSFERTSALNLTKDAYYVYP